MISSKEEKTQETLETHQSSSSSSSSSSSPPSLLPSRASTISTGNQSVRAHNNNPRRESDDAIDKTKEDQHSPLANQDRCYEQAPGQQPNQQREKHKESLAHELPLHMDVSSRVLSTIAEDNRASDEPCHESTTHQSPSDSTRRSSLLTRASSQTSNSSTLDDLEPETTIEIMQDQATETPSSADPGSEVVLKTAELESPNATGTLRHRKSTRSIHTQPASDLPSRHVTPQEGHSHPAPVQRKPSLSSVRDHVPAGIRTTGGALAEIAALVKIQVEESSPQKQLSIESQKDEPFDWEEDRIYNEKEAEEDLNLEMEEGSSVGCCGRFGKQLRLGAYILLWSTFFIPVEVDRWWHHPKKTIIFNESGAHKYTIMVFSFTIGYFFTKLVVRSIFKGIHKMSTVKAKISLEAHDNLVPCFARAVWLLALIITWHLVLEKPTCSKANHGHETDTIEEEDATCHRWVFWWVRKFLLGLFCTNILYIIKRYGMLCISDRFEQDTSRLRDAFFQGHVLDGLQKLKRYNRAFQPSNYYRRPDKSHTLWAYHPNRTPTQSQPCSAREDRSAKEDKAPNTATLLHSHRLPKRSNWAIIRDSFRRRRGRSTKEAKQEGAVDSPSGSVHEAGKDQDVDPKEFDRMTKKKQTKLLDNLRNKPIENPYKKARELFERICPAHRNYIERVDLEGAFKKELMDRVWKVFDPNGDGVITRSMFKKVIVDIVNLRKSITSTHKAFENAMGKLDLLFTFIWLFFALVAFLIMFDVGVQQYAVGVSSLVVGCAFVTGTSAKNAFESMIFIFVMRPFDIGDRVELDGAYFTIVTIHILTTEMKRGDGMQVFSPNYILATRHIHNLSRAGDHVENVYMDIPLFSTTRTITKLKQRIQTYTEGEASADFHKIDIILNATNSHTKDGTSRACLQILFRVFHRGRWVDSEFSARKLKSILFLREALNELEQEDLRDLMALRRSLGFEGAVLDELGEPAGSPLSRGGFDASPGVQVSGRATTPSPSARYNAIGPDPIYLAQQVPETMVQGSTAFEHNRVARGHAGVSPDSVVRNDEHLAASLANETVLDSGSGIGSGGEYAPRRNFPTARQVLVPETIQLSTNAANFQPFPNGFHFQR